MKKICYILLLTFFIGNSQNNDVVINFNNDDYQQKADSVLKKRYKLTKEFADTYPEIYEKDKLIAYSYEMEELKIYSIPIYTLKRAKIFKCGDNIIDFIDFTSTPESQYVNLEANGKYVGFTKIEADNAIDEIEKTTAFELMDKILVLDNPEVPILGNNINAYSYKERLEKEYFLFNVSSM